MSISISPFVARSLPVLFARVVLQTKEFIRPMQGTVVDIRGEARRTRVCVMLDRLPDQEFWCDPQQLVPEVSRG